MLITIARAAEEISADESAILRAIDQGLLSEGRFDDGTAGVYEAQLFAMRRLDVGGERWSAEELDVALDAISGSAGSTAAALRSVSLSRIAGQALVGRASFYLAGVAEQRAIGSAVAEDMGLGGYGLSVIVSADASRDAEAFGLTKDIEGNVVAVDGRDEHRAVLEALALYAYGDTREQSAAERWLTGRIDAAAAEGPVFADPVLQAMYDAAEPMPGDE